LRRLIEVETARPATEVDARPRTVDEVADELRDRLGVQGARVERLARVMLAKALAPKTVRNVMTLLHSVFSLAVENEWAKANPVAKAARPKRRREGDANPDPQVSHHARTGRRDRRRELQEVAA
jgi:hypothetical protein